MGFLKDLRSLSAQAAEARRNHDPVAQMQATNQQMRELTGAFRSATALVADPDGAVDGRVQIVSVGSPTGMVNLDPIFPLEVIVHLEGQAPVVSSRQVVVPAQRVVQVQPGAMLPARISRHDPSDFAVAWDRP
jgi:hypothetical protein